MIFESEFLILATLVFSVTASGWWLSNGPSFNLADLTIVEPRAKSLNSRPAHKPAHVPVLLPVSATPACATSVNTATGITRTSAGDMPLDTQTQLNRVSNILQNAIDLAAKAERLHNAAHEQLDSAHYALQNLLNELSAVMPITSKAVAPDAAPAKSYPAQRPTYVTALAA